MKITVWAEVTGKGEREVEIPDEEWKELQKLPPSKREVRIWEGYVSYEVEQMVSSGWNESAR